MPPKKKTTTSKTTASKASSRTSSTSKNSKKNTATSSAKKADKSKALKKPHHQPVRRSTREESDDDGNKNETSQDNNNNNNNDLQQQFTNLLNDIQVILNNPTLSSDDQLFPLVQRLVVTLSGSSVKVNSIGFNLVGWNADTRKCLLVVCCYYGWAKCVSVLLGAGKADPFVTSGDRTIVQVAFSFSSSCRKSDQCIVELLHVIKSHVPTFNTLLAKSTDKDLSPLEMACLYNFTECVSFLLATKFQFKKTEELMYIESGLHSCVNLAVHHENCEMLQALLDYNEEAICENKYSGHLHPFLIAVEQNSIDIVKLFRTHSRTKKGKDKIDLEMKNHYGQTALQIARHRGYEEMEKLLRKAGAKDQEKCDEKIDQSYLLTALEEDSVYRLNSLLNDCYNPRSRVAETNSNGETPFLVAVKNGSINCVRHLVDKRNCEINSTRRDFKGALQLAVERKQTAMVKYFWTHDKLKPVTENLSYKTAFHFLITCIRQDDFDTFQFLFRKKFFGRPRLHLPSLIYSILRYNRHRMLRFLIVEREASHMDLKYVQQLMSDFALDDEAKQIFEEKINKIQSAAATTDEQDSPDKVAAEPAGKKKKKKVVKKKKNDKKTEQPKKSKKSEKGTKKKVVKTKKAKTSKK